METFLVDSKSQVKAFADFQLVKQNVVTLSVTFALQCAS
jgi:hypothetical protein